MAKSRNKRKAKNKLKSKPAYAYETAPTSWTVDMQIKQLMQETGLSYAEAKCGHAACLAKGWIDANGSITSASPLALRLSVWRVRVWVYKSNWALIPKLQINLHLKWLKCSLICYVQAHSTQPSAGASPNRRARHPSAHCQTASQNDSAHASWAGRR